MNILAHGTWVPENSASLRGDLLVLGSMEGMGEAEHERVMRWWFWLLILIFFLFCFVLFILKSNK